MKKRLWSILLVACMVLTLLPFGALAVDADDVVWTTSNNGTTLKISCNGPMPDFEKATDSAWNKLKSQVKTVVIDSNVTTIGDNAFNGFTALTSVEIPEGVTSVGANAFSGCTSLKDVTLPRSVTVIGEGAFNGCTALAKVTFEETGIQNIAKNAFNGCTKLADVYYGGTQADWDKITINAGNDKLTKASGKATIHVICDANKHKIQKNIGKKAATCTEEGNEGSDICSVCGYVARKGDVIPATGHKWKSWNAISGGQQRVCATVSTHKETIKFPTGTTLLPNTADKIENATESITVPNTRGNVLWLMWVSNFTDNGKEPPEVNPETENPFTDVSANDLFYNAVLWAYENHKITVDDSKKLSPNDQLTSAQVKELVPVDEPEFPNAVPDRVTYKANGTWEIPTPDVKGDEDFTFVISTDGKTAGVLSYSGNDKNVVIPEKVGDAVVTEIQDGAFAGNETMESVSIPATVTSIGDHAFDGCKALKSVSIPSAVKSIGNYAFSDCDALTSVEVPEGVTAIGDYAFANCDKLASATLPKSLKTLGANIFAHDDALKDVYYKGGEQDWNNVEGNKFFIDFDTTLHYDADASHLTWTVSEDGKSATITGSKSVSGDLVIPATVGDNIPVVAISPFAFKDCNKLTSVTIPEGVTSIGESAFENCTGLKKVTLPKSLVMVDKDAFDGTNVKEVHYGSTVEDWANVVIKSGNDVLKNLKVGESFFPADCKEHKTEIKDAKEATCEEKGFTGNEVCTVCGKTIKAGEEIPALGHDWGEWTLTKPATATEKGEETRVCKRDASHVETRPSDDTGVKPVNFVDVNAGDYFADAVSWAVNHNPVITTGTDPLHFSPYDNCTRAQMVTFLWRAAGEPKPTSSMNPFTDVPANEYFYTAVLWAVEQNITTGTSLTTFSPYDQVTRAQTVTFLWRMAKQPVVVTANPFTDVPAGEYYTNAVLWAVQEKITTGVTATTFEPDSPCTRAQIVTFLYRDLGQAK